MKATPITAQTGNSRNSQETIVTINGKTYRRAIKDFGWTSLTRFYSQVNYKNGRQGWAQLNEQRHQKLIIAIEAELVKSEQSARS